MEEKDAEIRRLRAELVRMREREIVLKKLLGVLSETPDSGIARIHGMKGEHNIRHLCAALGKRPAEVPRMRY
jgi:hypothetical protein